MTGAEQSRPELPSDAGADDIERDIERTRQELGETVSALSDKLDVKGRVQDKAHETIQATKDTAAARKIPLAVVVAAVVVGLVIWRRKKRGK